MAASRPPAELDAESQDTDRSSAIELADLPLRSPPRRFWSRKRLHTLDEIAGVILAAAGAGLVMVFVDRIFRPEWDIVWADHWLGAPLLFVSAAVLLGLGWAAVTFVGRALGALFPHSSRRRDLARCALHGSIAGALCTSTARWTFSGKKVGETIWGDVGPVLFVLVFAGAVMGISWLCARADRSAARHRYRPSLVLGAACAAVAGLAFWADMKIYVALYERLHTLLEVCAFALLVVAFRSFGWVTVRAWPALRVPGRFVTVALTGLALSFVGSRQLRTYTDGLLAHAWVDQVYVGRTLKRAQLVELELDGGQSLEMARVRHIVDRFKLGSTELDDAWLDPAPPPSEASRELRGGKKNIVFFYVDTLRHDVAGDPELMPHVAQFAAESLEFEHAYAAGSDTLRSLPALTGGNYFTQQTHRGDLLALAERAEHESVLVCPLSAHEFLVRHRSPFRFEKTITVADYQPGKKDVWGYGADQATAGALVDEAEKYLTERGDDPFFLWLFHFDQHAWREIDEEYIRERQTALGVPLAGKLDLRYRVIARAIDEEFGRFLEVLERTGHKEDTVVVFLSDHGEGMGRAGFWVHSVFLWEELIRVPLLVRVPGVEPRVVTTPVGLVDVAPTLAPFFGLPDEPSLYHGMDLLEFAVDDEPRRRLPLVLRGANRDRLERIGLVDASSGRKLVLRLEAALPELYAVPSGRPDETNLARAEEQLVRRLLATLARSPVFPRQLLDFELLPERGTIEVRGGAPLLEVASQVTPRALSKRKTFVELASWEGETEDESLTAELSELAPLEEPEAFAAVPESEESVEPPAPSPEESDELASMGSAAGEPVDAGAPVEREDTGSLPRTGRVSE